MVPGPSAIIPMEDPKPFTPSRRLVKPPTTSASDEQTFVPNLRQSPASLKHTMHSNVVLAADTFPKAATAAGPSTVEAIAPVIPTSVSSIASPPLMRRNKSVSNIAFQSSLVLGDDSPKMPDFSPRKFKAGVKILKKQEHQSLATFSGYEGVDGAERATPKKIDPAAVTMVAGNASGKHRVY
ncbi:hypothetical protein HDU83_007411 [Entophlyctis luteolus]|nr:hypothetical protein HDU83_007411 [Entophlyctis luteolus]KAJ3377133.1 hypothetical protein HDU84_008984 [Entophlyctis sp. JEL0112]